ncbi:MAG: thioredoxin family protein [Bacteroidales bacterium]|nr:thioredoxin family protein [Bacteroidales bacterium]
MKKILSFMLVLSLALMATAQIQDPVKWSFSVKDLNETESELVFTAQLDQGWHLYSQHTDPNGPFPIAFEFTPSADYKRIGGVSEPKPHEEFDKDFNCTVRSFEGRVVFRQKILRKSEKDFKVKGTYSYQLCNNGSCIAPDDRDFTFSVKGAKAQLPAQGNIAEEQEPAADTAVASAQASEDTLAAAPQAPADTDSAQPEEKHQSLIVVFLLALLGGLLTMFTPCVFPMIPMTVNFFMNSTDNKRASRRQAWFFGLSIVFLFAVLGAILTLIFGPEALYFIGTHWVPNLIFFVIFLIFSLSFFGLFEIKMPEKWINKSDEQADKGGLLAPFFIALTTVLVSFSCTGPILGAALVSLSTSTTDRWVSLITMLGFGIGFAAPFTLLAMFPSVLKNMKSGGWLNTVKVVFAFLELAFGLKFLSMADLYCNWHLLDRETYLALWIVIFGLMGLYLLGKLKFKGDEDLPHIGVVRLFLAIIDLAFVVYMIPGLWGAPLKAISGFLPPMHTQDFNIERTVEEHASTIAVQPGATPDDLGPRKYADKLHMPTGFNGFFDLEEAKTYAKKVNKPIFIDFTGKTCANCREMEHYVWTDEEVKEILTTKYVMCGLYVDENTIDLPESEWVTDNNGRVLKTLGRRNLYYEKSMYNMNAQPYYVIINADGQVLTKENYKYDRDVQKFIAFLNEGLSNMK